MHTLFSDIILKAPTIVVCAVALAAPLLGGEKIDLGYATSMQAPYLGHFAFGFVIVWWWALYHSLSARENPVATSRNWDSVAFCLAAFGLLAAIFIGVWLRHDQSRPFLMEAARLSVWVALVGSLAAVLAAARVLVRLEARISAMKAETFSTFFQILLLPFGIWLLRPRIDAVLAQPIISIDRDRK
jgi:hypothetical protein